MQNFLRLLALPKVDLTSLQLPAAREGGRKKFARNASRKPNMTP